MHMCYLTPAVETSRIKLFKYDLGMLENFGNITGFFLQEFMVHNRFHHPPVSQIFTANNFKSLLLIS